MPTNVQCARRRSRPTKAGLAQALASQDRVGGQLPPARAAGQPQGGRVGGCPQAPGGLKSTRDFNKEGSGMTPTE